VLQVPAVDPALDRDMRLGFQLQIALARICAVVVFKRPLDIDWMGIVSLNEIGVARSTARSKGSHYRPEVD
jgi:hypothetical protein